MGLSRFGAQWLDGGVAPIQLTTTPHAYDIFNHRQNGPGVDALADGRLLVKVPGYYLAMFNLSFNGQAGVIYFAQMREDGVAYSYIASAEGIASGGRVNLTLIAGGHPDKDTYVQVYVYCNSAVAKTFTPTHAQFSVISL